MSPIKMYRFFATVFLGGFMLAANAQDATIGKVSIASPNAASLGKYGDFPVSYHTGLPNISIPIYTIESRTLKLPISLSYHAGGLKVQEQASWVGAGWSLNAGGVITRSVVGAPDDRGIDAAHTTLGHFADYGYNNYLFSPGGGTCGQPPCPTGATSPADDNSFSAGVKDGEPDLYFFNFNGYVGKFYFNDDRTPVIVPEQDFKIAPIYPYTQGQVSPYGILGFTVTIPNGDVYYFGKNQNGDGNIDAMEITTDITSMAPSNTQQGAVSSWFLNRIVSADGMDVITLSYQQDNYSYYGLSMFPVYPDAANVFLSGNYEYDLLKNFVQGVRLSKINFANGEVDFNPGIIRQDLGDYSSQVIADVANTQSPALGSIVITDNNGFCKKEKFSYGYFLDYSSALTGFFAGNPVINAITSDQYRLRLDGIQELTCDSSVKNPPYQFSYFSEPVSRKLSFGMDHWGFINGVANNQTLVPTYNVTAGTDYNVIPGANRDAHWPAMRGGALQQITYPTGGSTNFDYEANDTYVSYSTTAKTQLQPGFTTGHGNHVVNQSFITGSATAYELTMDGTGLGSGDARLEFKDPSGNIVQSNDVVSGATAVFTFTLSPGTTYTTTFTDNATQLSGGAGATLRQWVTNVTSGNVMVGGLRIKTITNNDALTAVNNVTSYAYTTGGTQSSGILYSRPVYVQELRNDIFARIGADSGPGCSANGCVSCDASTAHAYYKSPTSIRPMATTQGNHIGYNQVQVTQANNGYSIYRYYGSNIWDLNTTDVCTRDINITACNTSVPSFPAPPLPFEFMRGELKYEGHFNQAGQVLKDVTYFPQYVLDPILTPGYITQVANVGSVGSFLFGAEYYLQSAAKIKDSVISTLYDPAHSSYLSTTDLSYYNSPFHHQVTKKVTTTSTGDNLTTNIKYAADFRIASCDAISDGWSTYYSAYVSDSLNFYSQLASCTNTNAWNCKWLAYQQYRYDKSVARQSYVALRRTNYTDASNLFSTCHLNAKTAADNLLKPILQLQDEYLNPSIETSEWKGPDLRHAGLVKYDVTMNPTGFAYPARTQMVSLQATSATFSNASVSGNTITTDSRYLDETSFQFNLGNPQQVVAHNGLASSYIWDYANKEPTARVVNATVDQIAYTSFEADGNGSWTIGSVTREAGAITGVQSYNLSNGACSRAGLNSGTTYIVSYWSKTGAAFSVTGSTSTKQGKTIAINGVSWTCFEHTVTGVTTVSVTGTGNIDELRLYPANAQMTTYTYSPLNGMTSQCDMNNRVSYYNYDNLGRLQVVKDQDGNIIKTIEYHYKGQ